MVHEKDRENKPLEDRVGEKVRSVKERIYRPTHAPGEEGDSKK